jgi:thiol-disulfide isomerase/thioredoxin
LIRLLLPGALLLAALGASSVLAVDQDQPENAAYYPKKADAARELETALLDARAADKLAVIVFGGDWCHDSQALARILTSEAFRAEFGSRFGVTFIDVGIPQIDQGRNLELAQRFGIKEMKGTPTMVVISPKGKRLNSIGDAASWRNADSRDEADILAWFRKIAKKR